MQYNDHARAVIGRLVEMIRAGSHDTWVMPWHTHGIGDLLRARNATTGQGYKGANVIGLALDAIDRGYATGEWATYRQWQGVDAQVRKGERGALVVKWVTRRAGDADQPETTETTTRRLVPRVYTVFNAHQVDGHTGGPAPMPDTTAGEWITAIGADVCFGTDRAYYSPATDRIHVPAADQFDDLEAFHATVLHEHVHWTGHRHRLNRPELGKPFASVEYATEELVAELGAAIAAAHLGISAQPRPDHAAYLAHWLTILDADPKALFRNAAAAQRAVDHLDQLAVASLTGEAA